MTVCWRRSRALKSASRMAAVTCPTTWAELTATTSKRPTPASTCESRQSSTCACFISTAASMTARCCNIWSTRWARSACCSGRTIPWAKPSRSNSSRRPTRCQPHRKKQSCGRTRRRCSACQIPSRCGRLRRYGYQRSAIFPASDLMIVVDMGPRGARRRINGDDAANRGVGEMIFTPAFTSVSYTDEYQAELVAQELRGYRTIGWIGSGAMPHRFVTRIERELAGQASFVDATDFVDRLKAIKSEEEKDLIRKAAQMQDEIFNRLLRKIRPDMTGNDITALAQYEGRLLGSEQGLFLGSSAPLGQASRFLDRHLQARALKPGEHFTLFIENNGPGGFYTEIARTIVLGKASNELIDGFETMKEAQAHTLRLLKAGASCADIAQSHDDYMRSHNLPPELRLYCHGQGYDLVERPLIRCDAT